MAVLNIIPLIGGILALLLGVQVILNRSQNKQARWVLGVIVLLNAHNLFESYFFYNGWEWASLGLSYLHYHLIGFLFLVYSHYLFRIVVRIKFWLIFILGFTVLRLMVLSYLEEDTLDTATSFTPEIIALTLDNLLSILLNIGLLILAFTKIRHVKLTVTPNPQEQANYTWVKSLLLVAIVLYLGVFLLNVIATLDEEWLIYFKIESVINSVFSLALVFASMRVPVFSIHGDFQDLDPVSKKKYLKSSLSNEGSNKLWQEIQHIMDEEKPFLNTEYRLSDLAQRVDRSVHHVSQTINEQESIGFSDFINQLRVKEAKALLDAGRASEVTILAVSLEAGFNSKTAFYGAFKKVVGKSPSAYLKGS